SEEKRQHALSLGADAALDPNMDDLGAAIREANGGKRVDVVLEMAGGRVFDECLSVLAPLARLVTYGIASRGQNTVQTGRRKRGSKSGLALWLLQCLAR